jgi:hypothetical protein
MFISVPIQRDTNKVFLALIYKGANYDVTAKNNNLNQQIM